MKQPDGRQYERLRKMLTPDEMNQAAHELAREIERLGEIHTERQAQAARLRAEARTTSERVAELSRAITNGWREADVECLTMMDTPERGMKRTIRLDTNESVRDEPMTDAERQDNFGFMGAEQ